MASQQNLSAVIRQERGWAEHFICADRPFFFSARRRTAANSDASGHFICADRCRFRRNTLLTCGNVRIVVSTVGMWQALQGEYKEIGPDRYFETKAFHAKHDGRYWDADVSREVRFSSPWSVSKLDADDIANEQHEAVVNEIANRMQHALWCQRFSEENIMEEASNAKK